MQRSTSEVYGYAILLGFGGSLSLVTCLGMLASLIGENKVSIWLLPHIEQSIKFLTQLLWIGDLAFVGGAGVVEGRYNCELGLLGK